MSQPISTPLDLKQTIRLPQTAFPMRGDLKAREPETIARWIRDGMYQRMLANRANAPAFTLHDGPPYANGDIHHGHALNKILKDMVVKYRTMAGFRATNIPGWDCHGLPIEQKVDEKLGKAKADLTVGAFRDACRAYASEWVEKQTVGFQRLLVTADWEHPYRTLDASYEASILRVFADMIDGGYLYRGVKPVHWSWSAVTALAEAEVEYAPYTAPSVYVRFALEAAPDWLTQAAGGRKIDVVIWTTTPWTLPSNVAIALSPTLVYQLVALDDHYAIVVAAGLRESVESQCELGNLEVLADFDGERLVGTGPADCPRHAARHPFLDRDSVLVPADYVTLEQGTGCVHTAPGHGADDFKTGLAFDLPVLAPVNDYGKYTGEVVDYEGMHVFKANPLIAQRLFDSGRLLNKPTDTYHIERYPHCWRTKKPLIFRATAQWFARIDHDGLRERSVEAISQTRWFPHWGENRIRGMIEQRPDWCVSRQRVWGVPIPAVSCNTCGNDVLDADVTRHLAALTADGKGDAWFDGDNSDVLPATFVCPHCGAGQAQLQRSRDILDVWFDSGVSWAAVLRDREGLGDTADLYLEGSDQHRGWFHTSLLTAVATKRSAPYRAVLTHGFIVDEHGRKYSKSSGNFQPLTNQIDEHGAEVLRFWVAMTDYRNDISLTSALLAQAGGAYRKVRNTIRFLLGNLDGFDVAHLQTFDPTTLPLVDRWALARTAECGQRMREAFESNEFHSAFHALLEFCNEHLSAVYLDVRKDRMYCDDVDDASRIGAQCVMYHALDTIVRAAAPVLCFTADEAWAYMPHPAGTPDCVLLADYPSAPASWSSPEVDAEMQTLLGLRSRITLAIEARRGGKKGERLPGQIGSPQEAVVTLLSEIHRFDELEALAPLLAELCIVSEVIVEEGRPVDDSGVDVAVEPSTKPRCERCWNHRASVGLTPGWPMLCDRCAAVVVKLPMAEPNGPVA